MLVTLMVKRLVNLVMKLTGFVIGGPIIKDKLFFFVSQEEFTSVSPSEPYTYKVATQALVDEISCSNKSSI